MISWRDGETASWELGLAGCEQARDLRMMIGRMANGEWQMKNEKGRKTGRGTAGWEGSDG